MCDHKADISPQTFMKLKINVSPEKIACEKLTSWSSAEVKEGHSSNMFNITHPQGLLSRELSRNGRSVSLLLTYLIEMKQ